MSFFGLRPQQLVRAKNLGNIHVYVTEILRYALDDNLLLPFNLT